MCRAPWRARGGGGAASWRRASGRSCALTDLPGHVLVRVPDALALVRLGRAHLADPRGDLADDLLGVALHDDLGRDGNLELDALRRLDRDRVRVADLKLDVAALERGAVADALDLEALRVALGHALDHVEDQRTREAVERAVLAAVRRPGHEQLGVLLLDGDVA